MYEDAVVYLRKEENLIDAIETKILKMPARNVNVGFNTSEFAGCKDLLGELREKIPQKHEVVNTKELAESAGITDCDIDMNMEISYVPIDEKIKLVTTESGVYEVQLKMDTGRLMFEFMRGAIYNLRHGLRERKFFEKAGDDELLDYVGGHKFKSDNKYALLANQIIDTAMEKLKLPPSPEGYGPAVK